MKVNIQTIPHKEQRYETCGDWWEDPDGTLQIRVSDMGNPWFEHLVAIHEYAEWMQCKKRGVTEKEVSDFDIAFEANRAEGNWDEPGDDPNAPYHNEHGVATAIEKMLCAMMDIPWAEYDKGVMSL